MTSTNAYATDAELKLVCQITDAVDDAFIALALNAGSRWIDTYCARRFWLDGTATARTFTPRDFFITDLVNEDGTAADVATLTGLVVKSDTSGDGTFATTLTVNTDFRMLPVNAPLMSPEAHPWRQVQIVGPTSFATHFVTATFAPYRTDTVQVTAKWGWPAVPEAVHEACLIQAAKVFNRRYSPTGVQGFGDFGPIRVGTQIDPTVQQLLAPYRYAPGLVG